MLFSGKLFSQKNTLASGRQGKLSDFCVTEEGVKQTQFVSRDDLRLFFQEAAGAEVLLDG